MKQNLFFLFVLISSAATAQNDRLRDRNTIAWPQLHLSIAVGKKTDLLIEYQWRRADGFKHWQQSLLRGAVQYRLNDKTAIAVGYGWIETFPYGDHPIASNGTFPEHRLYEQIVLKQGFGKLSLTQRLRIEQRWIGRRIPGSERIIEEWLFSHRFRLLGRLQYPLTRSGKIFVAAADELFIAAGKNVGVNLFDQNRLMLLVGAKMNSRISLEAGYLSQTLVQSRRVNDQTILQDNKGLLLSMHISL